MKPFCELILTRGRVFAVAKSRFAGFWVESRITCYLYHIIFSCLSVKKSADTCARSVIIISTNVTNGVFIMKKVILSMLLSIGLVAVLPVSAFAVSPTTPVTRTDVVGYIMVVNAAGQNHGAPGAQVKIACFNNVMTAISDSHGAYSVRFTAQQCPLGSWVVVTATKDNLSGIRTQPTLNFGTVNLADILVNLKPNVDVPEMNGIVGIAATALTAGSVAVIRRRNG